MDTRTTEDGERLHVARKEVERGSKGPFFVVYTDSDRDARWGYFCANCEAFDNAMDSMGRIQCNVCSNIRKPNEWDAVHE